MSCCPGARPALARLRRRRPGRDGLPWRRAPGRGPASSRGARPRPGAARRPRPGRLDLVSRGPGAGPRRRAGRRTTRVSLPTMTCVRLECRVRSAGRLGVEQRREGQQLGVALLVEVGDRVGDLLLLVRQPPGRSARSAWAPRAGDRGLEPGLHLLGRGPGRRPARARDVVSSARGVVQLCARAVEARGGASAAGRWTPRGRRRRRLDLPWTCSCLCLRSSTRGEAAGPGDASAPARHVQAAERRHEASACGTGEEAHRSAFGVRGSEPATVTGATQTLRYLRVSTSVGSRVSSGPRIATTPARAGTRPARSTGMNFSRSPELAGRPKYMKAARAPPRGRRRSAR